MDHNRAKGLSLLHPTCLENVELVGGMEDVKMEPWNLLVSASFFSKLSLFHSPSNLCPLCLFLSFYLFSYFTTSFYFNVLFLWGPSHLSHLFIFQSPWIIIIPFGAWSKSSPPLSPGLPCPFLSTTPMWRKPHLSDAAGKK